MTSGTTSCTVHYNQPGDAVYPAATELTSSTTAQKAAQTITPTAAAPASAAYSTTFTVTAGASSTLAVAITTSGGCSGAGSDSLLVTMTSASVACGVQYAQAGDANYLAATPVNSSTTATPKALTVSGITVESRATDGSTNARLDVSGATLVGVKPGDVVTLDTSGAVGQFASPNAGSGIPVTVTGLTIGGADVALYTLTQPTLSATLIEESPPSDDTTETLPPLGEPVNDGLGAPVPALPGAESVVLQGADTPTIVAAPAVVAAEGGVRVGQVSVTVPPAAIPGAASISVRSLADVSALLTQAPPPSDGRIIAAISALALDARGVPVTGTFDQPAQIEVVLPAGSTDVSASPDSYVIVFWDGSTWSELPTRVTIEADGSVRLSAEALHFTLFAVVRRGTVPVVPGASSGAFAAPPVFGASGQAFAVYRGGDVETLEAAVRGVGGTGVWVQDAGGAFRLLIAGGPAFLRDEFVAAFPGGLGPAVAVTLVRSN
ncbi:MAG: YDG domain-containing protein [Dehalococcoidia bacterium]